MKKRKGILGGLILALALFGGAIVLPSDMPKEEPVKTELKTPSAVVRYCASVDLMEKILAYNGIEYAKLNEVVEPQKTEWAVEEYEEYTYNETYLGTYAITAYEWTGNPCANGNYPSEGYTVACNSLPLGTQLYIEGVGYRTVEDRGATWHSSNWIDLYLGDVGACYQWGVRYLDVYIVE